MWPFKRTPEAPRMPLPPKVTDAMVRAAMTAIFGEDYNRYDTIGRKQGVSSWRSEIRLALNCALDMAQKDMIVAPWNRWAGFGDNPAPPHAWVEVLFDNGAIGFSDSGARCWNDSAIIAWRMARDPRP